MSPEVKRVRDFGDHPNGCPDCGEPRKERQCSACGVIGLVVDCGHMSQPRPIASGKENGCNMHQDYCEDCR